MTIENERIITQEMIDSFKPTYLYVKTHSNLFYLGKTVKDPYKYNGSGKKWLRHINKYGKEHIETIWTQKFDNIFELYSTALMLSDLYDVVNSESWANLIPETGIDTGSPKGKLWAHNSVGENIRIFPENLPEGFSFGRYITQETRHKMRIGRLGRKNSPESIEKTRLAITGKPKTKEHVEKVRQAQLGVKRSAKFCETMSKALTGKKQSSEQVASRSGANCYSFKGYFVTPEFTTAFRNKITFAGIKKEWCLDPDKSIAKSSHTKSKYLNTRYSWEYLNGKSFGDLGFGFIPKNEYVSGCTD